jgi:hypothetical protein
VKLALPIRVHWFGEGEATNDEELRQMAYRAYADIEKAIAVDITLGQLAVDTRVVQRAAVFDGSAVWVAVDLMVKVIRTYGEASA